MKSFCSLAVIPFAMILGLWSTNSHASCTLTAKTIATDITMGAVTVPRNAAIGQVIASRGIALTGAAPQPIATCDGAGSLLLLPAMSASAGSALDAEGMLFPTNIEGIGIRFWVEQPGALKARSTPLRCNANCGATSTSPSTSPGTFTASPPTLLSLSVELVKTASRTGSGVLAGGRYVSLVTDGDRRSWMDGRIVVGGTIIRSPACEVDAGDGNIAVILPPVRTSAFQGLHSTTGEKAFAITLNCSETTNESGSISRVSVKLDGARDMSGSEGTLLSNTGPVDGLGSSSNATGVGVEITDEFGGAIQLGRFRIIGNAVNGTLQARYRARYRQTGNVVTAGKVHALAEFTIAYD